MNETSAASLARVHIEAGPQLTDRVFMTRNGEELELVIKGFSQGSAVLKKPRGRVQSWYVAIELFTDYDAARGGWRLS